MKEIKAIVQPFMKEKVLDAFRQQEGLPGVTMSEVIGCGKPHTRSPDRAADESGPMFVPKAQHLLGFMSAEGLGVPKNDNEAAEWFRRAADRGLKVAQAGLGFMYSGGRGLARDYVQAHLWLCVPDIAEHGEVRKQLAGH